MKRAKFKGIITITGIAGSLQPLKRRRSLWSSRTRRIGMSKIVEWEVAFTGIRFHLKTRRYHCGFTSCLHGNDENDHEKATHLNTQSKVDRFENATKWKRNDLKTYPCNWDLRLWLCEAIYCLDFLVSMLHYCANLKPIRYESMSLDRIVADKSYRAIVA